MGRHTSRLKPRTSTGRVIDSSPFSLVRGDANQRRETPENSTLGSLLLYYLVRFALIFAANPERTFSPRGTNPA